MLRSLWCLTLPLLRAGRALALRLVGPHLRLRATEGLLALCLALLRRRLGGPRGVLPLRLISRSGLPRGLLTLCLICTRLRLRATGGLLALGLIGSRRLLPRALILRG